jgi:outer membrane usher protein
MFGVSPAVRAEGRTDKNPATGLSGNSSPEIAAATVLQERSAKFPKLSKETTSLIVNVSINKQDKGDVFAELDLAGELYLRTEDLVALKIRFLQNTAVLLNGEYYVPLNALPDISYNFNEKNLTVSIRGKTREFEKTDIEIYPFEVRPQNIYYPHEQSAFLNYGLTYSHTDPFGFQSFSLSNKLGARTGNIFFISDSLYTKTESSEQFVRLSTSATYERRDDLQWFVLGDQFANSGDLGSSVNLGGIGFSKIYQLDPYFITEPLFNIKGTAQFPSEADIYMDGVLVSRRPIAPGQFELKNIYSFTGSHMVDVVLKDPFGNVQRIAFPLYMSSQLIREGLHEYSYNAGFLREQYGIKSNEYGEPVLSAFHRYGVTSALNIGARAEASDDISNAGVSTAFTLPYFGAFVLSGAGSSADHAKGVAGSFQHSYQIGSFNTNVQLREYSRNYATVAAHPSSPSMTRYASSVSAGFQLYPIGSFSLGHLTNETHEGALTRVMSANYSRGLTRTMSLFATASATRTVDTTYGFFIGINFTPAKDIRGAAQYSRTGDTNTETLQLQKDIPVGEGIGYRASLSRSDRGASTSYSFNPGFQYNAPYGIYTLDSAIQNSGGRTTETYTASAAGALVYAGGFYGLSRPVNDSFSIVMVENLRDATVRNNGQEIGVTDFSGRMVIPSHASYGQNRISLDLKNLPLDYSISGVNQEISPPIWSGFCVSFQTLRVRALIGTLYMQKAGEKMPLEFVDIIMEVNEQEVTFPTGKGGEFYMENGLPEDTVSNKVDKQSCRSIAERRKSGGKVIMPGTYQARVEYDGAVCEFDIIFPSTEEAITDIGDIICTLPEMPTQP